MKRIFGSKLFAYLATMVGAAILVVGAAAYISSRPDPASETATNTETYGRNYELPDTEPKFTAADLPKGVQRIAGEFILAAAGREDLAKAWRLTHPELRAQCYCTYKEWLTGNIPVQYYPSNDIETAAFDVEDITPREIFLRVLVLPKETSKVKPQVFDIGLKAVGNGAKKTWLVNYWNAKVSIPVPATPE
jgi:hypothetical protein